MTALGKIISLLLFLPLSTLGAQDLPGNDPSADSLLVFHFLKQDVELEKAGSYFNVLVIRNQGRDRLEGVFNLDKPEGWNLIGSSADSVDLAPGEEMLIPVRISIPGQTLGGVSYVIGAELFGEDLYNYANAYVSLLRQSRWDMHLGSSQIFLSDFAPEGEVSINLSNTGNSNEMIRLDFDMGGLLEFRTHVEADSFMYVEVDARRDTTLKLRLAGKKDLNYTQRRTLENSWSARSLGIKASTAEKERHASVRTTALESRVLNYKPILNSPLNTEVYLYNLISDRRKKSSVRVFGKVLFPESQQLDYSVSYHNIYFDPDMYNELDFYSQLRYSVRYTDPRSDIWLINRIGTGIIHTLTGAGIRSSHEFNDHSGMRLNVIQNPYAGNIGAHAGYHDRLGALNWDAGLTAERRTDVNQGHYSLHLGGEFKIGERHGVAVQTASSLSQFPAGTYLRQDTLVPGFAWQLRYRYRGERLRLHLDNMNTMLTHLRNSGMNRIGLTGDYTFNEVLFLRGRYYRSDYTATSYPYNFYFPKNYNLNENGQLLLAYRRGRITYQVGPQYVGTIRNQYQSSRDLLYRYANYQPGILGSVNIPVGYMRSLVPNATFSMMYYNYGPWEKGEDFAGFEHTWSYQVGLNYYDEAFKVSAYYTSGESSDIYRSAVINDVNSINSSIHVRPYYERYFFKDAVRMSTYVNYSYSTPSMREIILGNITGDMRFAKTWRIFVNLNLYRVSRNDSELGRITSNDLNLMLGVRKSFDIQQPRLAFYDLTIIGFNDRDGDGLKGDDEKPISNVLIHVLRDPKKNLGQKTGFSEISLITDPRGEVFYERIPEGTYDLQILPLSNLENLYFLNGKHQTIDINDDIIHYLPLVESHKIRGKVVIDRDPNSTLSRVSAEGIRVTAVSETGETYTALTDGYGTYVLNLPKGGAYEVSIYNIFGENFLLDRGRYKIQFTENKMVSVDFKFTEKRREIRMDGSEQYFRFNLGNGNN